MVGIDHKSSNLRLDGTTITQRTRKPPQVTRRSGCGDDFTSVKGRIPFHCNSLWATMIVIVIHCLSCQLERLLSHQRYWNLTQAAIGFNPTVHSIQSDHSTWRRVAPARMEMIVSGDTPGDVWDNWDTIQAMPMRLCTKNPLLLGYCCHCLSQLDQVTQNFRPVHFASLVIKFAAVFATWSSIKWSGLWCLWVQSPFFCRVCQSLQTRTKSASDTIQNYTESQ